MLNARGTESSRFGSVPGRGVCMCVGVGVCRSARSTDRRKGSIGRLDLTASR